LLRIYDNSLLKLLEAHFPQHKWQVWRFSGYVSKKSLNFYCSGYGEESQLRDFVKYMEEQLQLKSIDDWYRVSRKQLKEKIGYSVIYLINKRFFSLQKLLQAAYPEHEWIKSRFVAPIHAKRLHNQVHKKLSTQRNIQLAVGELVPSSEFPQ